MLASTAFVNADTTPEWFVKCYDKNNQEQELELAYKIGVNNLISLWRCDDKDPECERKAWLQVNRRHQETCLESYEHPPGTEAVLNNRFEICHQKQENDDAYPRRLVPMTVRYDEQDSTVYCEKSIFKVLYRHDPSK